jgi:hypothetical protein
VANPRLAPGGMLAFFGIKVDAPGVFSNGLTGGESAGSGNGDMWTRRGGAYELALRGEDGAYSGAMGGLEESTTISKVLADILHRGRSL